MNNREVVKLLSDNIYNWRIEKGQHYQRVIHTSGWWYFSDNGCICLYYKEHQEKFWTNSILWLLLINPLAHFNNWLVNTYYKE